MGKIYSKTVAEDLPFYIRTEEPKGEPNIAIQVTLPWYLYYAGLTSVSVTWEMMLSVCAVIYYFILTYETFYAFKSEAVGMTEIVDGLFMIDMYARFAVEFYRYKKGVESIFFFVPFSLSIWLWELAACCPLERIAVLFVSRDSLTTLKYMNFFRFNRFLRIRRMFVFFSYLSKENIMDEFLVFLIMFFTVYIIGIQFVACVFTAMGGMENLLIRSDHSGNAIGWLSRTRRINPAHAHFPNNDYIISVGFATSILTTVGFGDYTPVNEQEMMFGIFVMLVGAIGLAGVFGSSLTSFLLEQDGARFDLFYRLSVIKKRLKQMHASALFIKKTEEYYDFLWNYREGVYHVQLIKSIPTCMYEDILYDICTEMFHKAILFRDLEESFLRAVSRVVEVVLYNPDMIICQQGTYAMTMFYIIQGECLVKAKHNSNVVTAVLRAGCVFGESSLFFSFPYASNIETKTCCQLLRLSKERLMEVFNVHYYVLTIMRNRIQQRMIDLRRYYEMVGKHPVTWVQFRPDIELLSEKPYEDYPTSLRWATGLNTKVLEDIVDDTESPIIIEMHCLNPRLTKDMTESYKTCVVPPTLITNNKWIDGWHYLVMFFAVTVVIVEPYNKTFGFAHEMGYFTVSFAEKFLRVVGIMVFMLDVAVEIATACPVTGIYYKFKDGFRVKRTEFTFYLDLIAAIPFYQSLELSLLVVADHYIVYPIVFLTACCKIWKVIRYLRFLDDTYPLKMFFFRLIHTCFTLLTLSHMLACLLFLLACRVTSKGNRECMASSWLGSPYMKNFIEEGRETEELRPDQLASKYPYLISLYFSVAIISSAGFGDFSPITRVEHIMLVISELIGFFIIGYYTALLTSALSCTTRPRLFFEQKLATVYQFLNTAGLSDSLRDRIVEHYTLQHQYTGGVCTPPQVKHFMYDAPPYLEGDALYAETQIHLEGVPIFTKTDPRVIIKMAKLMDRYVLPPNIYFLRRGDVRRQMYILYKGSLAVLKEDTSEIKAILEATSHIGIRDLLFGEPSHNNIKTLSYCLIYSIDLKSFLEVFERDPDLIEEAERLKEANSQVVAVLTRLYADMKKSTNQAQKERKPISTPSWITFPTEKNPQSNFCDLEEYTVPFNANKYTRFMRAILMRRVVHPAGSFALFWNLLIGIVSLLRIMFVCIEAGYEMRHPSFEILRYSVHSLMFVDIYVKMHWAYYTEGYHLVCHPLKTAESYLFEGSFVYSYLCGILPYELMFVLLQAVTWTLDGNGVKWLLQLRWAALYNIIRFPIILQYGRSVFRNRTLVLLVLHIGLTVFICTIFSAVAFYEACPIEINDIILEEDRHKLPACTADSWVSKKTAILYHLGSFWNRWIAGMYYVSQSVFVIGFGDMIDYDHEDLVMQIAMMLFGFIVLRCIVSDLTASAVDSDETRAAFIEQMKCVETVLTKERVNPRMISNVMEHMKHTWVMSNGLQPQSLFRDLHPALQADLFQECIGDGMSKVPIFYNVRENIMRTVCQYLRKLFFTRGERIMRYGNVENEMYVIVEGDIWITNKRLEIQCTVGPGESFGETQMIFGGERRYSAIAVNHVEVYVLTSHDFARILERYPSLRMDMIATMRTKRDVFERKISLIRSRILAMTPTERDEIHLQLAKNTEILRRILYLRDPNDLDPNEAGQQALEMNAFMKFVTNYVVDWGSEDFDLPFIYFASPSVKKRLTFLLHPKCNLYKVFSFTVLCGCMLSAALGVYYVAFVPPKGELHHVTVIYPNIFCEIIFAAHIVLQFFVPFPTVAGKYCKLQRKIAFRYVSEITRFLFDVASSVPVVVQYASNFDFRYGTGKWLNVLRLLRIVHYLRTQMEDKNSITVSTFRYNFLISVPFFLLMAHVIACVFYVISACRHVDTVKYIRFACGNYGVSENKTWTSEYIKNSVLQIKDTTDISNLTLQVHRWWLRSFYWVVTATSTTGFGDILAENIPEMGVAIVCIFCGAFLLSIILSQFTSGVTSLTRKYREYVYQVRLLAKYLTNIGLTASKRDLVVQWFQLYWASSRGVSYHDAMRVLPSCIRIDVNLALYREVLSQTSLFERMPLHFLRHVADRVIHTIFLSGTTIVTEGDKGHTLYIVYKGKVAGYRKMDDGLPILVRRYEQGSTFGRLPALFYYQSYKKSYRAEQTTEVLMINQKELFYLAKLYTKFAKTLQTLIMKKYSSEIPSYSIFHGPARNASQTTTNTMQTASSNKVLNQYAKTVQGINETKDQKTDKRFHKPKKIKFEKS